MADTLPSVAPRQPEASTSTPPRSLCTVCNQRYSIYTCPRCQTRTCSLPCSTAHKARNACSGERERAAYVPMNQYGWGTMMDDYVFLEDVGRKVGEWGSEIVKGGFGTRGMDRGRGRGRGGRDRPGRGRGGNSGGSRTKRDILKMHLEFQDIDMDLLPVGMERRKLNQSSWDFKNRTALLTVEFKFHPPAAETPFTLLTHRNSIDTPLLSIIQTHITERSRAKKDSSLPEWIKTLVCPDPDDPNSFIPPQCFMSTQIDITSSMYSKSGSFKLDPAQSLAVLLRSTHFVEFPTIDVWEEGAFNGTIVDADGIVTRYAEEERKPKRRKLDVRAGRKAIHGLLGGYGSEEEDTKDVFSMLGAYAGSDEDVASSDGGAKGVMPQHDFDETDLDAEGETDDEAGDIDPAVLIELMRQAQARPGSHIDPGGDDDGDIVDWGESDEEDI